jgi:AcrR family transcriptional regulator
MSKLGFHGTSLQDISEKAGVSKSTIVHHFKSKEGILTAILDHYIYNSLSHLIAIVNDENISGVEKLYKLVHSHMKQLEDNWDVMKLFLMESKYLDRYSRTKFAKMQSDYWRSVEKIILQIQKDGEGFSSLDPKIIAIGILGLLNWVGFWYRPNGKYGMSVIAESMWQLISQKMGGKDPLKQ